MSKESELREKLWYGVPFKSALQDAVSSAMTGYKYNELEDDETIDADEERAEIDKLVNLLLHMFVFYHIHRTFQATSS